MINNVSQIITEIMFLYGVTRQPVSTKVLADIVGYSDRHMRRKLNYLKDKGLLTRTGKRGGWYPSKDLMYYMSKTQPALVA